MSLLRSADQPGTAYEYLLKSGNSGLSNPIFSSNKQKFQYRPEFYSEDYDQHFFSDSPSESFPASRVEFLPSVVPASTFHPHELSSYELSSVSSTSAAESNSLNSLFTTVRHPNPYQSHPVVEYLDGQSSDFSMIDYDEDVVRLKLQELERELLDDIDGNDDDFVIDSSMDFGSEWAESFANIVLPTSPKESSSSDSNISSSSSNNKETQALHIAPNGGLCSPLTPKQLLLKCAAAISEHNTKEAATMISDLRQMVSIQGDPSERIAAYMVEGLAARMATSGQALYRALKCKVPPSSDRLSAMQILFEVCPCFKFGFMAANGAIEEAVKDENRVHIIDFDINQGSQYMQLIQTLASRPGKPPQIRLTGVDDPESVQRTVGGLEIIGQRLEKFAESVGMSFEFLPLAAKTSEVTPGMLRCQPKEALIVNFAFQLHHMPDESVSTVNQRDQLLRMVKGLSPKLVTVVEQDVNTNTAPFFPRFVEAYTYYLAVFESLDATLARNSPDRMNVEKQCLARDIVNIIACEGEERIERYEVAGKWRARMKMAGFMSCPLSTRVESTIKENLKQYCDRFNAKQEQGALNFGWESKSLVVASAWK